MNLMEGGTLPGAGAIHISEIEPTLRKLEKHLGIDLVNNTLGSVGKKEYSGDIDVAIDISSKDIDDFIKKLSTYPFVDDIKKTSVIMSKIKIENYREMLSTNLPRTGYVQIDFMIGEIPWLKTYYHSPSSTESNYKGVFRNILLSTIAAFYKRSESETKIENNLPLEVERYLFSPSKGLVKIKRTYQPKKSGKGYTKKHIDEIIEGPWKSANGIAAELNLGEESALNSYETLKTAIEQNYPKKLVKTILDDFTKNKVVQDIGIPDDIKNENIHFGTSEWFRHLIEKLS